MAEKQRTYTYPDTLEFNYLDPDNIPELLEPYAVFIFFIFGFFYSMSSTITTLSLCRSRFSRLSRCYRSSTGSK